MSKLGFEKFINKKSAGKIKEEHRQEKRKSKAALRAAGDELRRQKLEKQRGNRAALGEENFRGGQSYRERGDDARKGKSGKGDRRAPQRGANGRFVKSDDRYAKRTNRTDARDSRFKKSEKSGERDDRNNYYGRQNERSYNKTGKYGDQKNPYNKGTKPAADQDSKPFKKKAGTEDSDKMPLNKFIAHSGICGRREAAELVKSGLVQVNGDIVFEPATKVSEKDIIKLKGKKLNIQVKLFYFLLNKPKDHITTTSDEKGRKTVLDLFKDVDAKHLYPVGRLDRNTTGVLLITNDGDLAQQLTHPSYEVKKIYEATLDRPLAKKDLDMIATGLTLEDGEVKADQVGYPDSKNKSVIGIEIHSGKNRIVRRIFEHLGYEVKKLDRVMFAGLTKKNVERGKWRYLSEKEIRVLKYMNAGGTKKSKKAAAESVEEADLTVPDSFSKKTKRTRIPAKTDHLAPAGKTVRGRKTNRTEQTIAKTPGKKAATRNGKTTRKEKY